MHSVFALAAAVALALPSAASMADRDSARAAPESRASAVAATAPAVPQLPILGEARSVPDQQQVRIEERVIIRIAPSPAVVRQQMLADLQRAEDRTNYREEKFDSCVPIGAIAGIVPSREDRLLLFLRDRRVLSASLERSCNPQDFYSGAYIERSRDGQLCSKREKLQSRTGASCRVTRLNRLVPAGE